MSARAPARPLLAPLLAAALPLSGCRFLLEGRVGRYRGEYPAWLPHVTFIGFFELMAQIWAIVDCWRSKTRGTRSKVIWTLFIALAPCLGFFLYFLFGYEG